MSLVSNGTRFPAPAGVLKKHERGGAALAIMAAMKHARWGLVAVSAALLALAAPLTAGAQAQAGASLPVEMGCINCHGGTPRGDAPSFRGMQERAASRSGDSRRVVDHWVEEMRATTSGWRTIVGHRQVSDETARALLERLAQPPARPAD